MELLKTGVGLIVIAIGIFRFFTLRRKNEVRESIWVIVGGFALIGIDILFW